MKLGAETQGYGSYSSSGLCNKYHLRAPMSYSDSSKNYEPTPILWHPELQEPSSNTALEEWCVHTRLKWGLVLNIISLGCLYFG